MVTSYIFFCTKQQNIYMWHYFIKIIIFYFPLLHFSYLAYLTFECGYSVFTNCFGMKRVSAWNLMEHKVPYFDCRSPSFVQYKTFNLHILGWRVGVCSKSNNNVTSWVVMFYTTRLESWVVKSFQSISFTKYSLWKLNRPALSVK